MNVFHKVTLQSLKKNKVRTIVTIIGIVLSTALVCAVTTSVSSFINYAVEYISYTSGSWHGKTENADCEMLNTISSSGKVDKTVYSRYIGYADINGENEYKPYLYIMGASTGFEDIMPVHIISGEYPSSGSEILLPYHLYSDGGVKYDIGDMITLSVGDRISGENRLLQDERYYSYEEVGGALETVINDEELVVGSERTYTVCGFYERPDFERYEAPGYTAITLDTAQNTENAVYDVYFSMKDPNDIYDFMSENNITGSTNYELLMFYGTSRYESFYQVIYGLSAIITILIIIGSISLIYNAFSISVSERTKQFGLLSSIGATKKQLRRMVIFEALSVSAIGIPLGITVGISGIGITFICIGGKFAALSGAEIPMRLSVTPAAIVAAVLIALVTVIISAWIPSKRATKVTAVEAIRQNADIKAAKKPVKTSKLTYRLFGLPGVLAKKYFRRSRKKYRSTIMSLFMSIVLFISATAFTDYVTEAATGPFETAAYDIVYYANSNNGKYNQMSADELLSLIKSEQTVKNAAYVYNVVCQSKVSKDALSDEAAKAYGTTDDKLEFYTHISFISDEEFIKLLDSNKLSREKFMNPDKPLAIAVDGMRHFNYDTAKYEKINLLRSDETEFEIKKVKQYNGYYLNTIYYDDENGEDYYIYSSIEGDETITYSAAECTESIGLSSGKTITEAPFYIENTFGLKWVYPVSMAEYVRSEIDNPTDAEFFILSDEHAKCFHNLEEILNENRLSTSGLYDAAEGTEEARNIITIIKVFAYGFIVLISLIAAANVFNTISTNVSLRQKDFAMLKSVGMGDKAMRKMLNYECILYGTKSLIFGLPVSAAITYFIYRSVNNGFDTDYHMPVKAVVIAVMSIFAVVFSTMMYSAGKIKKENPIDTLKNENI